MNEEANMAHGAENEELVEDQDGGTSAQDAETDSSETRIAQLEHELQEARDNTARRVADLDNMRKRFMLEKQQLSSEANRRLILDLLPTLDDLERTLEHAKKETAGEQGTLLSGVELVHRNLVKTLERYGVTPIESVGEQFDVELHDAMMEQPSQDSKPGMVLQEIQKGYRLNDTVLRHAKVIVSKEPE